MAFLFFWVTLEAIRKLSLTVRGEKHRKLELRLRLGIDRVRKQGYTIREHFAKEHFYE